MNSTAPDIKRRALGKGLDALLPRVHAAPAAEAEGGGRPRALGVEPTLPKSASVKTARALKKVSRFVIKSELHPPILMRFVLQTLFVTVKSTL